MCVSIIHDAQCWVQLQARAKAEHSWRSKLGIDHKELSMMF